MYETFYYKCVVDDNGNEQSLVFSCLLLPEKKELPFKDVTTSDPYYGSVWYVNNHKPLLMNGVSDGLLRPAGQSHQSRYSHGSLQTRGLAHDGGIK